MSIRVVAPSVYSAIYRSLSDLAATNLIPMYTLARESWSIAQTIVDPGLALSAMQEMNIRHAAIFAWVGIWLAFLVNSNLTRPLADMTADLQRIRDGHFEARVRVTTNDELGYVGDAVNEMASGLKEREFIKETFGKYVSKEVRDEVLSRKIPLDGEVREVSVLFADLRHYGTHIIVSADTQRRFSREFPLRRLPTTTLKGKIEPVDLYGP